MKHYNILQIVGVLAMLIAIGFLFVNYSVWLIIGNGGFILFLLGVFWEKYLGLTEIKRVKGSGK